jgi:Mismatch repair ATPase (MutS family)
MSKAHNLIDEYFEYQTRYEKQYGKNTLVLMQVGSFFEAYQTLDNGYDLSKISSMLNVILSRKNKSIATIDKKNPYMLGFPVPVIGKYMRVLMENGFTIVLIEQISPPPSPKREITGIYSPATFIETDSEAVSSDNKYILSIFMEQNAEHKTKHKLVSVGLALLDLSTGKAWSTSCIRPSTTTSLPWMSHQFITLQHKEHIRQ